MYQAQAIESNNEDGQITVEVQYRVKVDEPAIHALEEMGALMDAAVVRLHARPLCSVCGDDARYETKKDDGSVVHLCLTHVETTSDWRYAQAI